MRGGGKHRGELQDVADQLSTGHGYSYEFKAL